MVAIPHKPFWYRFYLFVLRNSRSNPEILLEFKLFNDVCCIGMFNPFRNSIHLISTLVVFLRIEVNILRVSEDNLNWISCMWLRDTHINVQWNILDIDECERDMHECDGNATCTNTRGGYNCTCDNGFSGNGSVCEGEVQLSFLNW
jgi:hypothetical protein